MFFMYQPIISSASPTTLLGGGNKGIAKERAGAEARLYKKAETRA